MKALPYGCRMREKYIHPELSIPQSYHFESGVVQN